MPKVKVYRVHRKPRLLRHGDQKRLALAAGVSQSYLCDILSGRRLVSAMKMQAIYQASKKAFGDRRSRAFRVLYGV